MRAWSLPAGALALALTAACGDDGGATPPDAATTVTTDHCSYVDVPSTARAGGAVTAGALMAGAGETVLDVPVGTALGGYTGRTNASGAAGRVDDRDHEISEGFTASIGIETAPRAKALALTAGDETVVIVKIDAIFVYEGMLFDLEARLGADYAGKVLLAASHSHSAWMQYSGHGPLKAGGGDFRQTVYDKYLAGVEAAVRAALAARRPARIGVYVDDQFDLDDRINRDRRGDNDHLPGGDNAGDEHLALIRVDGTDGAPIAVVPIFGEHGTLLDQDVPLTSTEATGGLERVLEEQLAGGPLVLHLQSAGADTSPVGHGGIACDDAPGDPDDPCLPFAAIEGHGRVAAPTLIAAWEAAGKAMDAEVALEMVTRSVRLGPDPATYTIRDGALAYAPFDLERPADGVVWDDSGALVSPIDEFNAPVGAALCETGEATIGAGQMPGTNGIVPYGGCVRVDVAASVLGPLFELELEVAADRPDCQMTRTTLSALRIGDHVLATIPGELSVLIADQVRARSPAASTIVVGYAQGHVGYVMTPEDWVQGGYESSITFWGPLEGEYLAERLVELIPLATTDTREDAAAGGEDRVATPMVTDTFPIDEPAPEAGTVPASIDADLWVRTGPPATAQPAAQVPRVAGLATFVWNGDDPSVKLPVVTLEREAAPDTFEPVTRRSGRPVRDGDLLLTYTPAPLRRASEDEPVRHVWAVEWQAVPWLGADGLDALDARAGVPLGRYRFHVAGDGWTLASAPFEVVPGGLAVAATRADTTLTGTVRLHAPAGFRLLDLEAPSNRPVPARSQAVTVALLDGGGAVLASVETTTDATGGVSVTDAAVATAASMRVTDRFGNVATAPL